jgi:hypothetical protein
LIANDNELEQTQARLLVCQSMIAHARQTLPPDAFWKRTRHWMEEWDRLDDEIREYLTTLPDEADTRAPEAAEAAYAAAIPTITARNTAQILGNEGIRLEFRTGASGDLIQTYELRGARAWGILQSLAGMPPERTLPAPALDVLKDRLDAVEFAIVEARNLVDSMLLGEDVEEMEK